MKPESNSSEDTTAALMTNAEQYRKLASQLRAKAHREESPRVRGELESLAKCYMLLAERADRNGGGTIANDPAPARGVDA
jgi:hypothetical protein